MKNSFTYGLVSHPIVEPLTNPPLFHLSTDADRVKWLCQGDAFEFVTATFKPTGSVELKKKLSGGKIDSVFFQIFKRQEHAIQALIKGEVDFVPAITDPDQVAAVKDRSEILDTWEAPSHYNLHYLGFRTDREGFTAPDERRKVIRSLNIKDVLIAGHVSDWKAEGLLPGFPGDELYRMEKRETEYPEIQGKTLFYNECEPVHDRIAKNIQNQLGVKAHAIDGYRQLVNAIQVQTQPECHMFLYNWYVRTCNLRRVLFPLFHSRSIPHPNLTRYDKADALIDQLPEPSLDRSSEDAALERIYLHAPIFVLYHAHRTAAWRKTVQGLYGNLTDPECNPERRLENVTVE